MVHEHWRARLRPALAQLKSYQVPAASSTPTAPPIRLNANESPLPLPADVAEALGRELARVHLNRYPDIRAGELRRLMADELRVNPEQLVFGNGGDELLALIPQVFAHPRPGQERARLLWPGPSFVQYRSAALGAGMDPVEVPLRRDFTLDADALFAAVERVRPNVIYFCRPNNPTGTLWPRTVVEQLLERYPNTLLMVDEAYRDYANGETVADLIAQAPQLIVLSTLSKWGLAGLRLGYVVASSEVATELDKLRGPYNLGALVQRTATFLLGEHRPLLRSIISTVVAERERVMAALRARGDVEVFPSATNFVLVRYGDHEAAQAVWQRLAAANILVRTFSAPGAPLEGCLRITIGTREENDAVLRALGDI